MFAVKILPKGKLRVAIVADWLTCRGGAENVVESFARAFESGEIFTTIFLPRNFPALAGKAVHTSALQLLPAFFKKRHRWLFRFFPRAIESFDFSKFDVVLSSSIFAAHGALTGTGTLHICFCHSPARFLWEQDFLRNFPVPGFLKKVLPFFFKKLRVWDFAAARRPDIFLANSHFTAGKIARCFDRKVERVFHPPVDFARFAQAAGSKKEEFFLWVGRLVAQKNLELLVETFRQLPHKHLKIVGTGNFQKKLRRLAKGCVNIEFLGFVPDGKLPGLFAAARATIFPQVEDAGIVPLESLAAGTPVIALRKGGASEILHDRVCRFFDQENVASLKQAVESFQSKQFSKQDLQSHAEKFSRENFESKIKKFVQDKAADFLKSKSHD